jgi:hypothetical protein
MSRDTPASMVVGHLDVIGIAIFPAETNAPSVVDANAPLTLAVAAKLFQSVGGRHAQEVECVRRIQGLELDVGTAMDVRRKTPHAATREKGRGGLVGEALNHVPRIVRVTFDVKTFVTLLAPTPSTFPKVAGSEALLEVRFTSA